MERLYDRIASAEKALKAFEELIVLGQPNAVERDATIQRFKSTFEITWKTAKQYLYDVEGIEVASPKGVIRSCREVNLFNDEETILALNMVNDRNLTIHTYNEEVVVKIHSNLKDYYLLLKNWIGRIKIKLSDN